jgi:hypothetical protein
MQPCASVVAFSVRAALLLGAVASADFVAVDVGGLLCHCVGVIVGK